MSEQSELTRVDAGTYRLVINGRSETMYIAGPAGDRWVWWNGEVFRIRAAASNARASRNTGSSHQSLTAPMPAKVARILVTPGSLVKKGETLLVLEAMKMELPVRALEDATVAAVRCEEGQLVQPDAVLVELEGS